MATLSIGISDSAVANGSEDYSLADDVVTKLVAWGRTAIPVTAPDTRTDGQVLAAIFDRYIDALKSALKKTDLDAARAAVSVPDIEITEE
jgi:hypothetical protein